MKAKTLELTNYAGYRRAVFDFTDGNGNINPIGVFYGPNGCGKSTGLHALRLLGNIGNLINKENDLFFRKMIFHPDYDPTLPHFAKHKNEMEMKAVFVDDDGEHEVVVNTGHESDGIVKFDTERRNTCVFIDADHAINRLKFLLPADGKELFLEMARIVYGYDVTLGRGVSTYEGEGSDGSGTGEMIDFYQDVIIDKGDAKVHFRSMSDGEKKIATLLRSLCDPSIMRGAEIVLIDNIEMHVYFERHSKMIDKLLESFPDKQFLVTSHSGILINHIRDTYGESCLLDVTEVKGQKFVC